MITRERGVQSILWADKTRLGDGHHPLPAHIMPVRIMADALGNDQALIISPQHCIQMNDTTRRAPIYVRAKHLAEETQFASYARGRLTITYHHMLLSQHASVFSNGVAIVVFTTAMLILFWFSALQCDWVA